jgi:hypothetical protein
MFGPVKSSAAPQLLPSSPQRRPSRSVLGTGLEADTSARVGCHTSSASKIALEAPAVVGETNVGMHVGPSAEAPNMAKAASTSSSLTA